MYIVRIHMSHMYMQKLWMYIFGIQSCWHEVAAKRGSEAISCLHHVVAQIPVTVNTLLLYGVQAKIKISNVMSYLSP